MSVLHTLNIFLFNFFSSSINVFPPVFTIHMKHHDDVCGISAVMHSKKSKKFNLFLFVCNEGHKKITVELGCYQKDFEHRYELNE